VTLSRIFKALRSGDIRLNGKKVAGDNRVAAGDSLDVHGSLLRDVGTRSTRGAETEPSLAPIGDRIVFESEHLLVISKQKGELVHGKGSLVGAVEHYLRGKTAAGVSFRPGPIHRLDRNTSGIVMFAVSLLGAQVMSHYLKTETVEKTYGAVFQGRIDGPQVWDESIVRDRKRLVSAVGDGSRALTTVEPVETRNAATLAVVQISTGRTHQIRAHARHAGSPLLGDRKYGGVPFPGGYILHAGSLAVVSDDPDRSNLPIHHDPSIPGFERLWTPLPPESDARVRGMFGVEALNRLYGRFSGAHRPHSV
jgi:23S rRNA pseudouridine955/2504/2580 synthase